MAAKDYELCVSALTGTVYISKVSKRNPNEMTDDRRTVSEAEFVKAIAEWFDAKEKENGTVNIYCQGKPIIEIRKL